MGNLWEKKKESSYRKLFLEYHSAKMWGSLKDHSVNGWKTWNIREISIRLSD